MTVLARRTAIGSSLRLGLGPGPGPGPGPNGVTYRKDTKSIRGRVGNSYMAKKSSIERNEKRKRVVQRYRDLRCSLKLKEQYSSCFSKQEDSDFGTHWRISKQLQALPRNSSATRVGSRCLVTGRPRSVYRDFGLSRHALREMAHRGLLPGIMKSSW